MKYTISLCLLFLIGSNVCAKTIFESGTLGATGIVASELSSGAVLGTSVDSFVYVGARFQLNQHVLTQRIGGHFVSASSGTFFGAIVKLNGENDTPDSLDLSTPDILGAALIDFPTSSNEVFGNLSLTLEPGWYSLVFGSGLFGTSGDGGAVRNGTDIGEPAYISAQPFSGVSNWIDVGSELPNHRFVLQGQIVPEPTSFLLLLLGLPFVISRSR